MLHYHEGKRMNRNNAIPRRIQTTFISTVAIALALLLVALTAPLAVADVADDVEDEFEITDLGPANVTVNVRSVGFGTLSDGTEVIFAISNGTPATFTMLDMEGEQLYAQVLDDYELGGWAVQAEDGTVYFTARTGKAAGLFSFDPDTTELVELDVDLQGQRVLYEGTIDDDGMLYFGTYPNAMVMGYNTETGEMMDYGSVVDDAGYVFSIGLVNGEIWAGTGPTPHLLRIDPETGEMTEMDPPEHVMDNTEWFIGIQQRGDHVFVRLSPRGSYDMAVYRLEDEEWNSEIIEETFAVPVSDEIDGNVYYLVDDVLTGFSLSTDEQFSTGFEDSEIYEEISEAVGTYGFTITDVDDSDFPGPTVVGLNSDGHLWRFNLETERSDVTPADVLGSPAGAHSMGVGPDGAVYMGVYLSSGAMSRIDPETQNIEYTRGPKQASAIGSHGDELVVSSYPGAGVYAGTVDDDWSWDQMDHVLQLDRGAPNYQDRIFALETFGDRLAVGSVPDYGELGGALTLLDTDTGDYEFHRNIIPDQSLVTLTAKNGLLFGGTSIHGGLDSSPSADEAEFFVWDGESEEVISSEAVVSGAEVITQVMNGPEETIWGLTDTGVVFIIDPESFAVLDEIETGMTNSNSWGRTTSLYINEADGHVYGNSGGSLFRIDPDTHDVQVIVEEGVRESAIDGAGQIYFADSTNAYALNQKLIEVTPEEVLFVDEPGTDNDAYIIPDSEGVDYLIGGESVLPGTYPGTGTVEVNAEPQQGYVFSDGAVTEWSHTFDTAAPPTDPAPTESEPSDTEPPQEGPSDEGAGEDELSETGLNGVPYLIGAGLLSLALGALLTLRKRAHQ